MSKFSLYSIYYLQFISSRKCKDLWNIQWPCITASDCIRLDSTCELHPQFRKRYSGLQLLLRQSPIYVLNRSTTKQPIFNKLVWTVKVSPHASLQISTLTLTGALKWGTVWTSTSTGKGIVKGQSLSNQIYFTKNARSTLTFHKSCASWGRTSYSTSF